jgi:hypothetical protein
VTKRQSIYRELRRYMPKADAVYALNWFIKRYSI